MPRNAPNIHFLLTKLVAALGQSNPVVRYLLATICQRDNVQLTFEADRLTLSRAGRQIVISPQHFLYLRDLSQHFDYYFDQVLPTKSGSNLVVDYSYPHLHRYKKSGLEFELPSFPEEQSALDAYLQWYTPKSGDTVFDIGAYCGVSTQLFSKLVGLGGRVYAFEPDPLNHELLLRNIRRHNMENVTPLQLAVSDKTGVEFFNNEGSLGSGIASHMSRASAGKLIRVDAISFEEACFRYSIPNFVKIDIEGAEIAMLDAARTFLRQHSIFFALDTNHMINGKLTASKVEEIFQGSGYHVASSESSGFMTTLAKPSSEPAGLGASQ